METDNDREIPFSAKGRDGNTNQATSGASPEQVAAERAGNVGESTGTDSLQVETINSYELDSAVVEIHRADRDETRHGWRAVIRQVSDKKIRMELDPRINPDALYGEKVLRGDVTVVEEMQENGDYEVKVYHLREVRNE